MTTENNIKRKELIKKAISNTRDLLDEVNFYNSTAQFKVNVNNGTVECQVYDDKGKNVSGGFSKCTEGEVFNVHIGKFIALHKALYFTWLNFLPEEFAEAVQPDLDGLDGLRRHNVLSKDSTIIDDTHVKY